MNYRLWSIPLLLMAGGAQASPAALEGVAQRAVATQVKLCGPTHIGFFGQVTVVTDNGGGTLYHRVANGPWQSSPFKLNSAHSVLQLPNGRWLINDTNNNRMIEADRLDGTGRTVILDELGGIKLNRPHDQILDPETGDVYLIDGSRTLFRFKTLEGKVESWKFRHPEEMDYARSLSWFDGKVHIIHSSRGEVLRVDDFDKRELTRFASPRPVSGPASSGTPYRDFPAGALSTTGLVLNDVEYFDGWYYGTNFFSPRYAKGGDTGPARLIRWKNWDDFKAGRWEDRSDRLPVSKTPVIPYYMTVAEDGLHIAYFGDQGCDNGGFVIIRPDEP